MQFVALIYIDNDKLAALPPGEFDRMMHGCIVKADELAVEGTLLAARQLEDASTAKSLRVKEGRLTAVDGPYAEAKEMLGGFNLIEADSMEEALEVARSFPWARIGCIEVRPVRSMAAVRARVGAPAASEAAAAAVA